MLKYILFSIITFVISIWCFSQHQTKVPTEILPFIPKGFQVFDYVKGDLNGDGKLDAILVLRQNSEDTIRNYSDKNPSRPMLLFIRQKNNKLKFVEKNDSLVACIYCGGWKTGYDTLYINKNKFTINFIGGISCMRQLQYSFSFNSKKNNWYLSNESFSTTYADDEKGNGKIILYDNEELLENPFNSFLRRGNYNEGKFKVIVSKTFFYENPNMKTRPRHGYLMKNDIVQSSREFKNFVEATFTNKQGKATYGYILKRDLQKL